MKNHCHIHKYISNKQINNYIFNKYLSIYLSIYLLLLLLLLLLFLSIIYYFNDQKIQIGTHRQIVIGLHCFLLLVNAVIVQSAQCIH